MNAVHCVVILLEKFSSSFTTKAGETTTKLWVADGTASIEVMVWEDIIRYVEPGDVLCIRAGYCQIFRNGLTLYVGSRHSTIERVGQLTLPYVELPNMSISPPQGSPAAKSIKEAQQQQQQHCSGPPSSRGGGHHYNHHQRGRGHRFPR
eukprot:Nk52_evm3s244 gene=Nk52_evmTU3s244